MSGYREIDSAHIVSTLETLSNRVEERFPGSSLGSLSRELLAIASECERRLERIRRPNWLIRIVGAMGVVLLVVGIMATVGALELAPRVEGVFELIQGVEAAINDVVFLGIALFFVFTFENRLKRREALEALHELRSIAHIIDMHQLTKDPERVLNPRMTTTASSPVRTMSRFELSRYLDYCSELLSLVGKVASLHAQHLPDAVVLAAVTEIENLAVGLSRKIWQKIMLLSETPLVPPGPTHHERPLP